MKLSEKKLISETERYSKIIENKLFKCEVAPYIEKFRKICDHNNWVVVSGSDQVELIKVLKFKKINKLFDDNIYGSPLNKTQIISQKKLMRI